MKRLAVEGGALVSADICDPTEVALARAHERYFEDENGYSYVLRPEGWRQMAEAGVAMHEIRAMIRRIGPIADA